MLAALLIVFREVFEAGLIVGIVMAVTAGVAGRSRLDRGRRRRRLLGACVVALFTGGLSELFGGSGQEIFNAAILGFAVVMLTWHNVWMSRHGREMAAELRAAGEAVVAGSKSLAALASWWRSRCCARVRKWCCFSTAWRQRRAAPAWSMVGGGLIGLVLGSLVCL